VSTYTYDSSQYLIAYTDKFGTTHYTYVTGQGAAREHALSSIAYSDNTHLYFTYVAQGRFSEQSLDGGALATTLTYFPAGGYSITDARGSKTTYFLSDSGQVAEQVDPARLLTRRYFDMHMNLAKEVLADGATYTFKYDDQGNLIGRTDLMGNQVAITYDPTFNRLTSDQDERGNTTRYTIDAEGNRTAITYADGAVEHFGFDPRGQTISNTNANGQQTGCGYDKDGQLTSETFPDGSQTTFTYDARGNLTSATNANGTTTYTFGALDLPTKLVGPDGTLNLTYNGVGQRTQSVDQTGFSVNYAYDARGRLFKLTDGANNVLFSTTYDPAGHITTENQGNGTCTAY
jgi:YD repeat-containing protein